MHSARESCGAEGVIAVEAEGVIAVEARHYFGRNVEGFKARSFVRGYGSFQSLSLFSSFSCDMLVTVNNEVAG